MTILLFLAFFTWKNTILSVAPDSKFATFSSPDPNTCTVMRNVQSSLIMPSIYILNTYFFIFKSISEAIKTLEKKEVNSEKKYDLFDWKKLKSLLTNKLWRKNPFYTKKSSKKRIFKNAGTVSDPRNRSREHKKIQILRAKPLKNIFFWPKIC